MTKNGVIVPICFIVLSGCSIFDNSELTTEPAKVAVSVVDAPEPAQEAQVATSNEAKVVPNRSKSVDDIRRLQLRLRELGFYPGAPDGVPGPKTKTAFNRLGMGCAKLEPLSENLPASVIQGASAANTDKVPSRADTIILQGQLRTAGFDPGPADGILGTKTRSLVAMLPSSCLMAKEFQGALDQPMRAANLQERISTEPLKPLTASVTARNNDGVQWAATQSGSQDEIRILQLRLRDAGFDPGPFDGVMGAKTRSALAQFEASQRNRKTKTSLAATKINEQY